ncbi:hypothetical protein FAES_3281 [Fibrella aestuarina BUZ 2]|uniref:PRTRC system protein C n=1 Tax=Fibrella aestuarina BUZ 2 TaxID=1166018 RepID=I0KAY7_9BACT|nr:PRTRC system protein C [Fibrella aestuarina]CCH01290.1 hypothetical protein FAES_3281 [Fibrella aestuarina BUZ 2]
MLVNTDLVRKFEFKKNNETIVIDDPNPDLSTGAVQNHLAGQYPELLTAKLKGPEIKNDAFVYTFETTMGTKG